METSFETKSTEKMTEDELKAYCTGINAAIDITNHAISEQEKRMKRMEKIYNIVNFGFTLPVGIFDIVIWDSIRRSHKLWK